jgi:predicted N-acetyltransferase YhbS
LRKNIPRRSKRAISNSIRKGLRTRCRQYFRRRVSDNRGHRVLPRKPERFFTVAMNLQIDYLVNHREHIPTLAAWFMAHSPEFFRNASLSDVEREHFKSRLNTDSLPISFIALKDSLAVGTIALLVESVTTHTHLSPWLGGLHVHPQYRHRGIGMSLVAHALKKAGALGFKRVYAGISSAEERYEADGWRVRERVIYCGKPLAVMSYEFASAGAE